MNDLECPIQLKVRFTDGTLGVRLLQVSDSTIRIGVARGGRGSGLEGLAPPPCGQLTRCFSAVAELLVFKRIHKVYQRGDPTMSNCLLLVAGLTFANSKNGLVKLKPGTHV